MVGLLGLLNGGLIALGRFTVEFLVGSLVVLIGTWVAGYIAFELKRLSGCRDALERLLRNDVVYENLLRDARNERDDAQRERDEIVTQNRFQQLRLAVSYEAEVRAARLDQDRALELEPEEPVRRGSKK
jgi:hypothetical protein